MAWTQLKITAAKRKVEVMVAMVIKMKAMAKAMEVMVKAMEAMKAMKAMATSLILSKSLKASRIGLLSLHRCCAFTFAMLMMMLTMRWISALLAGTGCFLENWFVRIGRGRSWR